MIFTSPSDYQQFVLTDTGTESIGPRLQAKLAAIPLPNLHGKRVLDLGCDAGFWCWHAREKGADVILGVDRNRRLPNGDFIDLIAGNRKVAQTLPWTAGIQFRELELGRQWHSLGQFEVILLFSLYHHIYQAVGGDHLPIWYWLRQQIADDGELLWENPISLVDPVVQMNVAKEYQAGYTLDQILAASAQYFDHQFLGPARHEPTREVYRFRPKPHAQARIHGVIVRGHGGAKNAFEYADSRRCKEFFDILNWWPHAGSLNVFAGGEFPWDMNYYRARILDVVDREIGVDGEWAPRWARFYPLQLDGRTVANAQRSDYQVVAFRFEGDDYSPRFIELVGAANLGYPTHPIFRDEVYGPVFDRRTGRAVAEVDMRLTR